VQPTALDTMRATYSKNGVLGFYRGYSTLLFFTIPRNSITFGVFTLLENNVFTEKSMLNTTLCGMGAGVADSVFAATIAETVKTKLIHDQHTGGGKYQNVIQGTSKIYSQEGFFGLYRGVTAMSLNMGVI